MLFHGRLLWYPMGCNTPAGLSQQAVPGDGYLGRILTRAHPAQRHPAQYHEYELLTHGDVRSTQLRHHYQRSGYVQLESAPSPAPSVPSEETILWLSRIRVRRVAHAVLWGDGLRSHVFRDGRLPFLPPDHTLTSIVGSVCVWCVHRQARLHGLAILFGSLPCLRRRMRQQIRTSRWRVTPGRVLGRCLPATSVHMYARIHTT